MGTTSSAIDCTPTDRARAESGRSLTELLSSLTLFAILVGSTVPTVARNGLPYSVRGATRELFADLQKARISAANENNRYVFTLVDGHTYTLLDDTNNNGTADTGEAVTTVSLQADWPGVTISGTSSITFLTDGTVLAAGSMTVTDGTRTKTVTVTQAGSIKLS